MLRAVAVLVILTGTFSCTTAISCLSCQNGAEHLYECAEVQQCRPEQACFIERVMPLDGGRPQYTAGCRDMSLCNIEGCSAKETKNLTDVNKRSDLVICSECCYRSLCNIRGCGGDFGGGSDAIRCFNCPEVYGNKSCNSFIACDRKTQMCQSKAIDPGRHPADPSAVELGCGNIHICEMLRKLYLTQSLPREQWQTVCCDDEHLCNWKPLDNTSLVESIANKLTCPPDLVERTTHAQGLTAVLTSPITNTPRTTTTTLKPPSTTTTTTTKTTTTTTITTTTTTPKPTTPSQVQTSKTVTAIATVAPTTEPPPFQLGSQTTKCHQCTGPIQICEQIHFSRPCFAPNNYCINHITNHLDGTRTVNRTCGNFDTCYREWYLGTSDEDKCDVLKNNQHVDFQCTFCCINDDCNIPLRPDENTLYKPRMTG